MIMMMMMMLDESTAERKIKERNKREISNINSSKLLQFNIKTILITLNYILY